MKKLLLGVAALAALTFTSCSDDDDTPSTSNLTLAVNGLQNLGTDFQYEGWIIVDGNPVTTGTFSVDDNGVLSRSSFSINSSQLAAATNFVLSIEPIPDTDPSPAATKMLAGAFNGNSATIWAAPVTPDANMFDAVSGKFFLRTPTDETSGDNGNNENGIWFGNPGMPPTASLDLPVLSPGWKYEGWVVAAPGAPITTGTFTSFNTSDNSAPFSGTENAGPPVPGEDFFNNAPSNVIFPLDVRGKTVVISIEPDPDNNPAPFAFKPLVGTAGQALAPATHDLLPNTTSFITGTVTR